MLVSPSRRLWWRHAHARMSWVCCGSATWPTTHRRRIWSSTWRVAAVRANRVAHIVVARLEVARMAAAWWARGKPRGNARGADAAAGAARWPGVSARSLPIMGQQAVQSRHVDCGGMVTWRHAVSGRGAGTTRMAWEAPGRPVSARQGCGTTTANTSAQSTPRAVDMGRVRAATSIARRLLSRGAAHWPTLLHTACHPAMPITGDAHNRRAEAAQLG